ncbi:MAG TPA: glutamate--tRNA ligase [Gammaproteobacteria bacterium]|nr:glutamate--tRNA ligase [Gammaproteobacteria bacterium]
MTVRTRFAPSPTGYLHIGGARTALFSWLYARANQGQFILRIEDTDRERSTEASVRAILEGMEWLRLDYDEGPYYQTDRMDRYREVIQRLLDQGDAYYCYCSKEELDAMREAQMARKEKPRYDGRCRDRSGDPPKGVQPVIRFRNPREGSVVIDDRVKGRVEVSNSELDDLIIARSDGSPTYNLTVVVDDLDMGITHVIRGDDHLNNTPRQVNILRALGEEPPVYAHVPMILGEDGKRLSKRHGAMSVMQYERDGFLPEALLNYLVRLGWSHGDQEIFSREEMIELFTLEGINRAPSTFSPKKLQWLNEQYLKSGDPTRIASLLEEKLKARGIDAEGGPALEAVVAALRERSANLNEMADAAVWFYREPEEYDAKAAARQLTTEAAPVLAALRERLSGLEDWNRDALRQAVSEQAKALNVKMGQVGMPLRVALTGGTSSPDIGVTLELIGKASALARIDKAVEWIQCQ